MLVAYEDLRPAFGMASSSSPEVRRCVVEISHFLANEPNLLEQLNIQIDGEGIAQLANCINLMTDEMEKEIVFKFIQKLAITQNEACALWIGSHTIFNSYFLTNATSPKSDVQDLALAALLKLLVSGPILTFVIRLFNFLLTFPWIKQLTLL